MEGGKQTTTQTFDPARNQFLQQIFGTPGGRGFAGGAAGRAGTPGVGFAGLEEIFGSFRPTPTPLQQQATGGIQTFLNQEAPEQRAFRTAQESLNPLLTGTGQFGNVAEAAFPIFQRNLTEGLSQLGAQAPGRFGSAFLQQGTDLAGRSTQDFNLFVEQARQSDIQNRLQANLALGTLAGQAGQNPFARLLAGGQFGMAESQFGAQQQQAIQLAILQMLGQPTGQVTSGGGGIGSLLGGIAGFGLGSFGGPLLAGLGGSLGSSLFGGGAGGITRTGGRG
jgi:hypothetical protein